MTGGIGVQSHPSCFMYKGEKNIIDCSNGIKIASDMVFIFIQYVGRNDATVILCFWNLPCRGKEREEMAKVKAGIAIQEEEVKKYE